MQARRPNFPNRPPPKGHPPPAAPAEALWGWPDSVSARIFRAFCTFIATCHLGLITLSAEKAPGNLSSFLAAPRRGVWPPAVASGCLSISEAIGRCIGVTSRLRGKPPVSDNACGADVPVQDQAAVHALEDPVGQTEIIPCLSGQVCADAVAGSKPTPVPEEKSTCLQGNASDRMHGRGPGHGFRAQCWDCEVSQLIVLPAMSPLAAHSADSHRTLSARPAGAAGGGCPFGGGRFGKFGLRACMGRPGGVAFSKSPAGCVGGAAGGLKTLIF